MIKHVWYSFQDSEQALEPEPVSSLDLHPTEAETAMSDNINLIAKILILSFISNSPRPPKF